MATVADILSELGDHGFSDTGTTRKVSVINDTIWDICSRESWPFLEKSVDLTFTGSSSTASNLPSDFRAIVSLSLKDSGNELVYMRLDEVDKWFGSSADDSGSIVAYYLMAGVPRFVKKPASSDVVRMRYLSVPAAVIDSTNEAGIVIPPRHHRVIVLGSLWKLYDMEDDPDLAQRFETHYENRIQTMKEDLIHLNFDQPEYILVSDPEFGGDV